MQQATRYTPTTEGAAFIRAALAGAGIKARVAKQRFAYRIVSDDTRALSTLVAVGLSGPLGGEPVRLGAGEFSAYDFRGIGQ